MADVASYIEGGDGTVRVRMRASGHEITVDEYHWDRALVGCPQSFIPAVPGTYVLRMWWETEKSVGGYYKKAVIGWGVGGDGYLHPWTVDGPDDGSDDLPAIVHPDGRVEDPINKAYDSLVEWYEEAKPRELARGYHRRSREPMKD